MKAASGCLIGLVFVVAVSAEPLLEGRVRLASGEPVADAQVRLFDLSDLRRGAVARARTDGTGYFSLPLVALGGSVVPAGFTLGQNYPNPFNPSTIIPYRLAASASVRLEVFNLLGQRIAVLVDGERPAGFHTANWNATDAAGRAVGAGVYLYRMAVGGASQTGRMVLIDGQAGVAAVGAAAVWPGASAGGGPNGEAPPVYGLTVSGSGLVPYVDPAFRVPADREPVALVVETLERAPRAKRAGSGILGDVDNNNRIDFFDALIVALYSGNPSIVIPNNGDIALGDVDRDGQVTFHDAYLIALYLADPLNPSLPPGIGALSEVAIPDGNLRWAIEAALGKASGAPITAYDMEALRRLDVQDAGISDLTGLEFAPNLESLKLLGDTNEIADLSALSGLTHLTSLHLEGTNQITDVSALSGLTHLTWLTLDGTNLTDVSALGGLTKLETIQLWGTNEIADVSALGGLTKLSVLSLDGTNLTDVSALSSLTNLRTLQLIGANQLTDLSALGGLTNLTWLLITGANQLTDLSALGGLPYLEGLTLGVNNLADLSALGSVTSLTFLHLRGTNEISDLSALGSLTYLRWLYLEGSNQITDLSVLGGLTNLRWLYLDGNKDLTDVSVLGGLTHLTGLSLRDNDLTDVSALGSLANLTELTLDGNKITDVSVLGGLTNLTELSLSANQITDLSSLGGLTNLKTLDIRGNPLSDSSINEHIPALESRGVTVVY